MTVPYWRLSSFYFFYLAALGSFIPYWSLYLKGNGFNPAEIGQLSALLLGTKVISPNLWGWIADRSHQNLNIIRGTAFLTAFVFAAFLTAQGYVEFAWVTIAFGFFWNAPLPLYEATTLAHLRADAHRYSLIRLWGSVGFILAVAAVGKWLDVQPVRLLPWAVLGLLVFTWLTTLTTPESRLVKHEADRTKVVSIIKKPEVLAFLLVYVLLQAAHAPYYVFYSVYLEDHLYSTTTTGLLWSLGVVAEIVLFLLMKSCLNRFRLRGILLTSLAFSALRWLLIGAYVDEPLVLLFAQLLHAASFGGTHIAAIHFVHKHFDQHHQGKGQALYHSVSFGLGGMIGSLASGQYWESLGSHVVYTAAAMACGIAFIIAYIWVGRQDYCYT